MLKLNETEPLRLKVNLILCVYLHTQAPFPVRVEWERNLIYIYIYIYIHIYMYVCMYMYICSPDVEDEWDWAPAAMHTDCRAPDDRHTRETPPHTRTARAQTPSGTPPPAQPPPPPQTWGAQSHSASTPIPLHRRLSPCALNGSAAPTSPASSRREDSSCAMTFCRRAHARFIYIDR